MDERVLFSRLKLPNGYQVDVNLLPSTNAYRYVRYATQSFARLYSIRDTGRWVTEYRVVFNDNPHAMYTGYDLQELMMRVVSAHRVMGHD